MNMINHPTHPRTVIALQETHRDVQNYLKEILPPQWIILTPPDQPYSLDLFLYDSAQFDLIDLHAVKYSEQAAKTIFTITLQEKTSNKLFRFLQSHIPGGPVKSAEGCAKFSTEALSQYDPELTVILMGDMNQSPQVIAEALRKAAEDQGLSESPYVYLPIPHPSHMNTHLEASWIDHFFVSASADSNEIRVSENPDELSEVVTEVVELLEKFKAEYFS